MQGPLSITIAAPGVLLILGLAVNLYLDLRTKAKIARLGAECRNRILELEEPPQAPERTVEPGSVRPAQGRFPKDRILALHELGESPAAISRILGLPAGQVSLLLKVRRLAGQTS
jgi:hypothetical protein